MRYLWETYKQPGEAWQDWVASVMMQQQAMSGLPLVRGTFESHHSVSLRAWEAFQNLQLPGAPTSYWDWVELSVDLLNRPVPMAPLPKAGQPSPPQPAATPGQPAQPPPPTPLAGQPGGPAVAKAPVAGQPGGQPGGHSVAKAAVAQQPPPTTPVAGQPVAGQPPPTPVAGQPGATPLAKEPGATPVARPPAQAAALGPQEKKHKGDDPEHGQGVWTYLHVLHHCVSMFKFQKNLIHVKGFMFSCFSSKMQVEEPASHLKKQVQQLLQGVKVLQQLTQLEASPATGCYSN